MTSVNLNDLELQVLKVLGALLILIATWAVNRLKDYLGQKNTDAQKAQFSQVLNESLQLGLAKAVPIIKEKGWDHVDVKSQTLSAAANYAIAKFPDALKAMGISPDPAMAAQQIAGALERKFADQATIAAASPVTPPAPAPAPAAVVSTESTK